LEFSGFQRNVVRYCPTTADGLFRSKLKKMADLEPSKRNADGQYDG
jgi:hypothetical protein